MCAKVPFPRDRLEEGRVTKKIIPNLDSFLRGTGNKDKKQKEALLRLFICRTRTVAMSSRAGVWMLAISRCQLCKLPTILSSVEKHTEQ